MKAPNIRSHTNIVALLIVFLSASHVSFAQTDNTNPGKISGKVVDAESGETIIGANVVITGTSEGDATDIDGRYTIDGLNPGIYSVTVSYISYTRKTVTGVDVNPGKVTTLNVSLHPETLGLDEITVTASANSNSEAGLLSIQRKSIAVQDGLSSEYLSKAGDSDVAAAMKRVTGVTLLNGKDVFVRGLGNRYSNVQLNGAQVPSTNPNQKEAPVDLVGSGLVDNIVVQKTFTPDQSGEFSGGSVQITTREFPEYKNFSFSYSTSYNTVSTFNNTLGYEGGSMDFLGYDDGKRRLPDVLANQRLHSDQQLQSAVINALHRDWAITESRKSIPSQKITFNYADQFNESGLPIGLVTSFSYKYDRSYSPNSLYREIQSYSGKNSRGEDQFVANSDYTSNRGSEQVKLSGLVNLFLKPSQRTKIGLKNLYSNSLVNSSTIIRGTYINYPANTRQTVMDFDRRTIFSSVLEYETYLQKFLDGRISASLNYSRAVRSQPDRRTTQYNQSNFGSVYQIYFDNGGNNHFFSDQDDNNYSAEVDVQIRPFDFLKIKSGSSVLLKRRTFSARRFEYQNFTNSYPDAAKTLPVDKALAPQFVEDDLLEFLETTQSRDSYDGEQNLAAGYLSTVWTPSNEITLELGGRVEYSDQEVFITGRSERTQIANVEKLDLLPAANLTYNISEKSTIRGAFSITLARPEFREISDFRFQDFVGSQIVFGNPDLIRTRIYNYDVRFETYPNPGELFAVSLFYKRFNNPIEVFYRFTERTEVQYKNADEALLYGLEGEARKNLTNRLQLVANTSYIFSETLVKEAGRFAVANPARPMFGQSPYTVNVSAFYTIPEWNLNLGTSYNTFGKRLVTVGLKRHNYDEYEQSFHSVTFSADYTAGSATFSLGVENLLNDKSIQKQGDLTTFRYEPGMTFDFGIRLTL